MQSFYLTNAKIRVKPAATAGNNPNKRRNCSDCFNKDREIERLRERVKSLEATAKRRENAAKEKPFGESTPSSKVLKSNSKEEDQKKVGGAKVGHKGAGRNKVTAEMADAVEEVESYDKCPECAGNLRFIDSQERFVLEYVPAKIVKKVYRFRREECTCCYKKFSGPVPALPRAMIGNRLLAEVAVMHYVHGMTLSKVTQILGSEINESTLHQALERLGELSSQAKEKIIEEYKLSSVKHADETGWRTDGENGYAWVFCNAETSIFEFRDTRSSQVVQSILGNKNLPGVLVVDRYQGYNKAPCQIQYCYAHLLRDLQKLEEECGESDEVKKFVAALAPELALAMGLRNQDISDEEYYKRAHQTKENILKIIHSEAKHLGVRSFQDIFRDKENRMYHWVKNRKVPPDNNYAERDLRPTVIARKISFGSQSAKGARKRGNIMTILHTARKRIGPEKIQDWLTNRLNQIAWGASAEVLASFNHT